MEKPIQCVSEIERVNIFGVRHLSPGASFHLLQLMERTKPKCVLIEGPSDASELVDHLTDKKVKPPIAILAYTADLPVETAVYPFAEYSPEYQAVLWAKGRAVCRFIDLPSGALLRHKREQTDEAREYYEFSRDIYNKLIRHEKAVNFDDYFERTFEHNLNENSYEALALESDELRQLLEPREALGLPNHNAQNIIREAHMAMCIQQAMEEFAPEEIMVITGAYHAKRLLHTSPMTADELKTLPCRKSKITLMPYSFYRLSTHSGYGAGNNAPAYYQLMWECILAGKPEELPYHYMSLLGRYIRENGGYCGTSNVIEAVRLAQGLTYLKDGSMPTLHDLHDAALACIGSGEESNVTAAFAAIDIGTAFGELPEGMSQTSVQDDFNRELRRLKLEKYKSTVSGELDLDLRENIRVKSEDAAFIDLNRSTFLHRLHFLGISFAIKERVSQQDATWRERWKLCWTPEAEIQLVESVLKGETIELAAAYSLIEQLKECEDVSKAAELITAACICKLTNTVSSALSTLQRLTADSGDFTKTASACFSISQLILYGDLRRFDTTPLVPLLSQLFLRGALLMVEYAGCDNQAADAAVSSINALHIVSQENHEHIDDDTWVNELMTLSARDDRNAKLSGLAFAILLERNLADEEFCAKEVSRRLSPGIPADIGAGWFEGISMRNRYALLSRTNLWKELDAYIAGLDDDEFKRSVVFLRRAFSSFDAKEKSSAAMLLGGIWAMDKEDAAIVLQAPLDEGEIAALEGLDDFDFDL